MLQAALPVVLVVRRGAVAQELLCHEDRGGRSGSRTRQRGFGLRRVRGFRVLAEAVAGVVVFVNVVVDVVVAVVVDMVVGVFHPWLVRGPAGARTTTRVPGGGLSGSPAGCAPAGARSSGVRHRVEVVENCGRTSAPYLARQMSVSDSHVQGVVRLPERVREGAKHGGHTVLD